MNKTTLVYSCIERLSEEEKFILQGEIDKFLSSIGKKWNEVMNDWRKNTYLKTVWLFSSERHRIARELLANPGELSSQLGSCRNELENLARSNSNQQFNLVEQVLFYQSHLLLDQKIIDFFKKIWLGVRLNNEPGESYFFYYKQAYITRANLDTICGVAEVTMNAKIVRRIFSYTENRGLETVNLLFERNKSFFKQQQENEEKLQNEIECHTPKQKRNLLNQWHSKFRTRSDITIPALEDLLFEAGVHYVTSPKEVLLNHAYSRPHWAKVERLVRQKLSQAASAAQDLRGLPKGTPLVDSHCQAFKRQK